MPSSGHIDLPSGGDIARNNQTNWTGLNTNGGEYLNRIKVNDAGMQN